MTKTGQRVRAPEESISIYLLRWVVLSLQTEYAELGNGSDMELNEGRTKLQCTYPGLNFAKASRDEQTDQVGRTCKIRARKDLAYVSRDNAN